MTNTQLISISLNFGDGGLANFLAILYILCGLGIFLFGINMMGSSLKSFAGDKIKVIVERSTNTPVKGMLVGFATTMLTQSASGTSALAVSLVGSGLMTFGQAIGVLLGANIGGTILTIILAIFSQFKIMPMISVALVFIGATIVFFFKKKRINSIGSVILGFGFIFLGLALIDMSFDHFIGDESAYKDEIEDIFNYISKVPVLGITVGTLFTIVVQSSSATIGIVQEMFSNATISLKGSLAIMLGANIGTTITALLASLGSTKAAKKVAVANILIKLFGVVCFGICFSFGYYQLTKFVMEKLNWENNPMIIALAHLAFNIVNSFVFLLLIRPLTYVCNKIVKDEPEKSIQEHLLDYSLIQKSPNLALSFAKSAIDYMASLMKEYVYLAKQYSFEQDNKLLEQGAEYEKTINSLDKRIHDYLIKLTIAKMDDNSSIYLSKYLDIIKDIERVGDHCTNILEFFNDRNKKDMHLSSDGIQDLEQMYGALLAMTDGTYDSLKNWDMETATETVVYEDQIDLLEEALHERHVHRVNSGVCSFNNTEHYVEILSNIERMGDHLKNILDSIMIKEYSKYDEFNH